jgi:hypothetical protein
MKSTIVINHQRYVVEVWMMKPIDGMYRFGMQAFSSGKIAPYSIRLSEEFIEDEIDNNKNQDYLEKVAMKVAVNHLSDMLTLPPNNVIANLGYWFRDAKKQLDGETNENTNNLD